MGLFDLLGFLGDRLTAPPTDDGIDEAIVELADRARSDRVTPDLLNDNEHTRHPLVVYVDDEQPEHVLHGGKLIISDGEGSTAREHPAGEQRILVSDRRILFVVGGRLDDQVREVPLETLVEIYLDTESVRRYLVVEADREGTEMTFFADVTLDTDVDDVQETIQYVRSKATERRRSSTDASAETR